MMKKRKWMLQLLVAGVFTCSVMVGCGSSATSDYKAEAPAMEAAGAIIEESCETAAEWDSDVWDDNGGEYDTTAPEVQSNRKLITTMNLDVETTEFDELMLNVEKKVAQAGGYIENSSQWNGYYYSDEDQSRNASLTIRVPADNLDSFVEMLDQNSNITNKSKSVEDVTLSYVDLESHKNALKAEEQRILELLDQAETLEEILQIEEKLTDVRYRLDSMESQLRTYDNQINYSTLYLNISEVQRVTPAAPESTWDAIKTGFSENMYRVGNGLRNFGIGFVVSLPFIVVFVIALVIFVLIVFLFIKVANKVGEKVEKKRKPKRPAYLQPGIMQLQGMQNQAPYGNMMNQAGQQEAPASQDTEDKTNEPIL